MTTRRTLKAKNKVWRGFNPRPDKLKEFQQAWLVLGVDYSIRKLSCQPTNLTIHEER